MALLVCLSMPGSRAHAEATAFRGDVVLGMSAAFTGPSRGLGVEFYRGAQAFFQQVNLRGGVHGQRVTLRTMDDGYNPTPAVENTMRLLKDPAVLALFGYVGTPTTTRVLPLLRVVRETPAHLFFPFTGAQPLREPPYGRFVFNLRASYHEETAGLVDRFFAVGRRRIAVFYQADAYGRSGWEGVRRALAQHDAAIVGEASYQRGRDFSDSMMEQARLITAAEPDAVIAVGAYGACAAFIRDARALGLEAPIANLSFVGSEALLETLQTHGDGALTHGLINSQVTPSYEDLSLPAVREYRAAMDAHAPLAPLGVALDGYEPLRYSFVSLEGFLAAKVMTRILERMGPEPSPEDLLDAAHSLGPLDVGLDALIAFGPDDHQGLEKIYYTTVEDGVFAPIVDWSVWKK